MQGFLKDVEEIKQEVNFIKQSIWRWYASELLSPSACARLSKNYFLFSIWRFFQNNFKNDLRRRVAEQEQIFSRKLCVRF